jgi:hypothetical protein
LKLENKDYEKFLEAYKKLGIKFSVGNLEIKNLNILRGNKKYEKIISEYSDYLKNSFDIVEQYWRDEGATYERSAFVRSETSDDEERKRKAHNYKFALYDIIEVN